MCTHICLPFHPLSDFLPICSPSFSLSHGKQHGTYLCVPRSGPFQKELALTAKEPPNSREADSLSRHHEAPVCSEWPRLCHVSPGTSLHSCRLPHSGCHESCTAFPKAQDLLQSRFSGLNLTKVGRMHAREKHTSRCSQAKKSRGRPGGLMGLAPGFPACPAVEQGMCYILCHLV